MSLVSILNDHFHKKVRVTSHEKKTQEKNLHFHLVNGCSNFCLLFFEKLERKTFLKGKSKRKRNFFSPHNGPLFATMEASTHHMLTPKKKMWKKSDGKVRVPDEDTDYLFFDL